jgi:hypothetical protein
MQSAMQVVENLENTEKKFQSFYYKKPVEKKVEVVKPIEIKVDKE